MIPFWETFQCKSGNSLKKTPKIHIIPGICVCTHWKRSALLLPRLAPVFKTFFINVSFRTLGASLTLMALFKKSHQSKTSSKFMKWHIDEKCFKDWSQYTFFLAIELETGHQNRLKIERRLFWVRRPFCLRKIGILAQLYFSVNNNNNNKAYPNMLCVVVINLSSVKIYFSICLCSILISLLNV